MKLQVGIVAFLGLILLGCAKQTTKVSYPEKFEGLTQLVLASETKNIGFTDTTVMKIVGIKIASSQIKVYSNVTFDFYVDFEQDGYTLRFSEDGQTVYVDAPPLRVKKPVINSTNVSYPEKGMLINEEAKAVEKLQKLTDEFIDDGEALLKENYVREKSTEMLHNHIADLLKKMGFSVKTIKITFREIQA